MELDELKGIWKEAAAATPVASGEQLHEMLQQRSRSPIAKMKRNLRWELAVLIALYAWVITDAFLRYSGGMLSLAWLLVIIGLAFLGYYYKKMQLLRRMECVTCEVKSNLQQQVQMLEKYVRLYLVVGTALLPVVVLIAGLIGYFYAPTTPSGPDLRRDPAFFLIFLGALVVIGAVLTVPVWFINKWYIRKLYGQHIDKLKAVLAEMESL
ncbi:MAG TPA: hypothetical protein PKE63_10460 [Lacibacter sp.]|nr:hypothetical protein [Lacibacter sp.]HMO88311.1 hypothetical protein [Lacibacter sp.]HMP87690.1 hypothetical protein [Lacibacter sp.]